MRIDDDGPSDPFGESLDRAWELISSGDLAGALKLAEQSLELDSDSPDVHNLLGFIHAAGGNTDKALEHYSRAIELDEYFVEAMLNAADLLIHPVGDFAAALRLLDEALIHTETDDERTEALVLAADCHMQLGDRETAAKVVASLPAPPYPTARLAFMVGKTHFEMGELEPAEALLRDARSREPENADASYFLGLVLEARADREAATVEFLTTRMLDAQVPGPPWSLPQEHFERRVRAAIKRLAPAMSEKLEGSLVVAADLPGLEVVAEGVDPRLLVLLDDFPGTGDAPDETRKVGRVFVYQRNVERSAPGPTELADEVRLAIERELVMLFPALSTHASSPPPPIEPEPSTPPNGRGNARH